MVDLWEHAARAFKPAVARRSRFHDSPAMFAREYIDWRDSPGLTGYQAEILDAVPREKRVAVRGPHGLGKTTDAAIFISGSRSPATRPGSTGRLRPPPARGGSWNATCGRRSASGANASGGMCSAGSHCPSGPRCFRLVSPSRLCASSSRGCCGRGRSSATDRAATGPPRARRARPTSSVPTTSPPASSTRSHVRCVRVRCSCS